MNIVYRDVLLSWLINAPLFAVLVDRNYQHLPEHRWLSDIEGAARGWHEPLFNKRVSGGAFFADDVRFLIVRFQASAVAIYVKKATFKLSPVICYADTMTGLPTRGVGGDVIVPFSQGIIRL